MPLEKGMLFIVSPAIEPTTNPNRLPTKQKIANTMNFPATKSFFDTGIIIAYRAHLELSSKEKVVTIIMLHKIAHTKFLYPLEVETVSNNLDIRIRPTVYRRY